MSDYWEKRAVQRMYDAMELAETAADEIGKTYLKASRYICHKLDEIFDKFKRKHNLSDAEARRLISRVQDKTSLDEIQRLVSESKSKNKELIPELESNAYRARLERLRQLQNELDLVIRNVYLQEKQYTTSFYTDLANEIFYKSIYDIQQRAGVAFSFNHISEKQINKVLSMDWSGQNYSKRIWKNTQTLANTVKEELLINLLTGRTNREVAEIITNKFASGAAKARRLVRTESNFISSELNHEAYKEAGIEEYQYLATLDLRTSEICRELDGKIFKVSERKVGVNCNPMHPWCRSTTVPVIDREFLNDGTRSARDPVTGKTIKVPASMNYKEWYKKFVEENNEAKVAERKLKNKSADKKQHEKYKEILGDNVPNKLDDFQEMKYNQDKKWKTLKAEYAQETGRKPSGGKRYAPYDSDDKKDVAAANEYKKISKRDDSKKIAESSGMTVDEIRQIKRHIFYNKHKTYEGYKNLYPDYDMAVAWKRLYEGCPEERDILLLKHELLESKLEKEYNLTISEAHAKATEKFDWAGKLEKELGEEGEMYGLL